ncbi:unnamed protein product [Cuscuta epithymum]|uniref:Uncharacterized protein n=1 Tax=Cuscuta epithymum TaxID=186058 RepID=A0AAV0DNG0_9ASTE|nr:unnamed protein product [Cuscuta epithymum]
MAAFSFGFSGGFSPPGFSSSGSPKSANSRLTTSSERFLNVHGLQTLGLGGFYHLGSSSLLKTGKLFHSGYHIASFKRNFGVCFSGGAGIEAAAGSFPDPNPLTGWIIGILVSMVVPFLRHKFGSLTQIKNSIQQAEEVVHRIEQVAEVVDKVAEDIGENLPAGKLKDAVALVEHAAEKVDKEAEKLEELIDKVEELEEKVEDRVESFVELSSQKTEEYALNKSESVESVKVV